MRVISSLEWCWEVKQSEDGMVTYKFGHMEDVEGFNKSFVQDRSHIGAVWWETVECKSEDVNAHNFLAL